MEAEKLSLPPEGTAGKFDVTGLLSDELRLAFLEPSAIATKVAIPKGPKIARRVTEVWLKVLTRLDLKSALFALAKDDGLLRTLLNRERRNATEESRDGVTPTFPHG